MESQRVAMCRCSNGHMIIGKVDGSVEDLQYFVETVLIPDGILNPFCAICGSRGRAYTWERVDPVKEQQEQQALRDKAVEEGEAYDPRPLDLAENARLVEKLDEWSRESRRQMSHEPGAMTRFLKAARITKREMVLSLLDCGRPPEEVALALETTVAYVRRVKAEDEKRATSITELMSGGT